MSFDFSLLLASTKTSGADYTGKIYVPFLKGTPDGKATLKYVLQNTSLTITEKEQELTLARPDYQYITLVTADGTQYRMERKARNEYAANAAFPAKVNAYIVAPKYGDNGNELTFGWDGSGVALGASQEIPFSSTTSGKYDISFSTFSFEASPFAHIYFCGKEMSCSLMSASLILPAARSAAISRVAFTISQRDE